jgi:hypothetical protein
MKIWAKTEEFSEGKYLVVRRDGTTPAWPHFVIGGDDPSAPAALRAYADDAHGRNLDAAYVESIDELANDFAARSGGKADPDAGPHRTDLPLAIAMMRGQIDLATVCRGLEQIENLSGEPRIKSIARMLLNGQIPLSVRPKD